MEIMAFIPARGGSKRIPKKNIALLGGEPLIAHTIECARNSEYINRIIVSTDDDEVAETAIGCGAEAPFRRPKSISKWDSVWSLSCTHASAL